MRNYDLLPEHMRHAAKLYIEDGIEPGGFLSAVICNDLAGAVGRADPTNAARLKDIVCFFYNETPSPCWGSEEKMNAWMDRIRKGVER